MYTARCKICNSPITNKSPVQGMSAYLINCTRCGEYVISESLFASMRPLNKTLIPQISHWIRNNQRSTIHHGNIQQLMNLPPLPLFDKAVNLLKYLAKSTPIPGHRTGCNWNAVQRVLAKNESRQNYEQADINEAEVIMPIIAESITVDLQEFSFIIINYLRDTKNYIDYNEKNIGITPKGWAFLEQLKYSPSESNVGFIAMWFDKSMDTLFACIESAIWNAGYEPKRVDKHEHINKIDDEIVALIRRSKFMVADFTEQRGGVYFESGFALGLNKPVIWVCREDQIKDLHFDTNHFNYLTWITEKLPEFTIVLHNRIEAVIGKGPLVKPK